jgi:hypothetical protein
VKAVLSALLFISSVCWATTYNTGDEPFRDLVRLDFEASAGHYQKHLPYISIRSQETNQDLEESEEVRPLTETGNEEEQAPSFNVTDLGNNWYEHEHFGTFYDKDDSDWYYHLDHGWIYVDEWDDNGTWMYMPIHDEYYYPESNSSTLSDTSEPKQVSPGWMWSNANIYPQLYSDLIKGWMYGYGKGIFYDYRTKSRYGYGFDHWELDFTDSNNTTEEIREKMDAYFQFFSHDFENDPFAESVLPFDINPDWRPLGSLTTISLSFPKELLSTDNNWSDLIQLFEEIPNEMEKRGVVKLEKDEDLVTLVGFTGAIFLGPITYADKSEVMIRTNNGTIDFNVSGIVVKPLDINLSALSANEFNRLDGHWYNKVLQSGKPAFTIHKR